jgi:hypothetical protein
MKFYVWYLKLKIKIKMFCSFQSSYNQYTYNKYLPVGLKKHVLLLLLLLYYENKYNKLCLLCVYREMLGVLLYTWKVIMNQHKLELLHL